MSTLERGVFRNLLREVYSSSLKPLRSSERFNWKQAIAQGTFIFAATNLLLDQPLVAIGYQALDKIQGGVNSLGSLAAAATLATAANLIVSYHAAMHIGYSNSQETIPA